MKTRLAWSAASLLSAVLAIVVSTGFAEAQRPAYRAATGWAQLPGGMKWETVSGTTTDHDGHVYGFRRAEPPIIKLTRSGAFVASFGDKMFAAPHGIRIDPQGMLWVTDVRGQAVYKLDAHGQVLLTLGEKGVSGDGPNRFNGPTDIAVTSRGDVFVTDGQTNHRIVHFSRDGKFVNQWGSEGTGPGQFKVPHSIAVDAAGRLLVADRDNGRIQIFDQAGTFLEQWTQFGAASGLFIDSADTLYVAAVGERSGLLIADAKTGQVRQHLSVPSEGANGPHLVTVDGNGTVYVTDILANDLLRFVPD